MRILTSICLVLLIANISCDQGSSGPGDRIYDYLLIVRNGGGDKSFTVQPLISFTLVDIYVTRYQFRDTLVFFQGSSDESSASAFSSLDDAMHGRVIITGDFHQSTLPTGTWAFLYMVRDTNRFEITNSDLRNQLLGFEALVQHHFPPVQ
jgi:hypothetical protein